MPSKTKRAIAAAAALPSIPRELIDQFVTGPMSAAAVNAASIAFKKPLIERVLGAELSLTGSFLLPNKSDKLKGNGQPPLSCEPGRC